MVMWITEQFCDVINLVVQVLLQYRWVQQHIDDGGGKLWLEVDAGGGDSVLQFVHILFVWTLSFHFC